MDSFPDRWEQAVNTNAAETSEILSESQDALFFIIHLFTDRVCINALNVYWWFLNIWSLKKSQKAPSTGESFQMRGETYI